MFVRERRRNINFTILIYSDQKQIDDGQTLRIIWSKKERFHKQEREKGALPRNVKECQGMSRITIVELKRFLGCEGDRL